MNVAEITCYLIRERENLLEIMLLISYGRMRLKALIFDVEMIEKRGEKLMRLNSVECEWEFKNNYWVIQLKL